MRSRITITISEDLLSKVDETIDNKTIRNRSQAIESLLHKSVSPRVSTAVILAGGSLTKDPTNNSNIPKALVPIKNKSVLSHMLKHLQSQGFSKAIICTSPNSADQIRADVTNSAVEGIDILFSDEKERLGTGGALKNASKLIGNDDFILIHGDVLTDLNLKELIDFYLKSKKLCVVGVKPRPGRLPYGRIFIEGNSVVDFQIPRESSPISLVNTGIYIFSNKVLSLLPKSKKFKLEETLIPDLVKKGEIQASVFQGIWFDVTDPESYEEANERWDN